MADSKPIFDKLLLGCEANHDWYRAYLTANWQRIHSDFAFIRTRLSKQAAILDIGAVPPLLAALLNEDGFKELTVVDPCATVFAGFLERYGIKHHSANLLNALAPELTNCYDLVCLNEVVEHISGNLLTAIGNSVACVKPGGFFMVTTPNLRSISGLVSLLWYQSGLASKPGESVRAQYEKASAKFGYYGHLREFTPREVVKLVESFGMTHVTSEFLANYQKGGRLINACCLLERFLPNYRLCGKYLFKRTGSQDSQLNVAKCC